MSKSEKSKIENKIMPMNFVGGTTIGSPQTNNYRYSSESEGQRDFYDKFKDYIPEFKDLSVDEIMDKVCILSTDGTWD